MLAFHTLFGRSQWGRLIVQDQFLSASLGNTLFLKAAGFIEDHQAEILDVNEESLTLKIGVPWWGRYVGCSGSLPAMRLSLSFHPLPERPANAPQVPQSRVVVAIRPGSRFLNAGEFQQATRQVLWQLRYHFMACS